MKYKNLSTLVVLRVILVTKTYHFMLQEY